jgi:hypothetical protein
LKRLHSFQHPTMLHALSTISILLLSVSGLAKPIPRAPTNVHLPISRKINAVDTAYHNALEIDQHRARLLRDHVLHPAAAPNPNEGVPEPVTNAVVSSLSHLCIAYSSLLRK